MPQLDADAARAAAREAGFHAAGVARAAPLDPGPLARVLQHGWEADMAWLGTQARERLDPARLLPGARSVLALALAHVDPQAEEPPAGRVARYARGRDYHGVMRRRLKALVARLRELDPAVRTFASADIAPVMEKAWAQRAGLGWVGKNGCLITPRFGSWVLLATVLLDRELAPDAPHPERCGDCDACLHACPTAAIPAPGFVDARACISFQTIERRGPVDAGVAARLGPWAFGCDDCQTACPWNRGLAPACDPELAPRRAGLDLAELLRLTPEDYRARFHGTALARARYEGLVRNGVLAAGARGDRSLAALVAPHLASPFPGVRAAARLVAPALGLPGEG